MNIWVTQKQKMDTHTLNVECPYILLNIHIIDTWNNVNKMRLMSLKMKCSCDIFFWYRPMQEDFSH